MRASAAEYRSLPLRGHDLLRDVPLYDVSSVDLPGGGSGRTVADIRALEAETAPSHIATLLYGLRYFLGRVFGWDREPMRPEDSFLERLSERDRRDSEITPGTLDGHFWVLYQFPGEALRETRNRTVHGFICTALVSSPNGYRLYWGVYVRRVSWLTRPYLVAIEPDARIVVIEDCIPAMSFIPGALRGVTFHLFVRGLACQHLHRFAFSSLCAGPGKRFRV
jgi:Protein of unknown function (DUF2867)